MERDISEIIVMVVQFRM